MKNNLIKFSDKLKEMDLLLVSGLFNNLNLSDLNEGDFVYIDPPYLITSGSYNDGNRGFVNWNEEQENILISLLENLTQRNIKWALSNVLIHKGKSNDILSEFISSNPELNVHYLNCTYKNCSHNTTGESVEILLTNYKKS